MKRLNILAFGLCCFIGLISYSQPSFNRLNSYGVTQVEQAINSEINNYAGPGDSFFIVGLAVGIIKDGKIAYLKGFGHESINGDPIDLQSNFHIASISKTVTAVLALQMWERGELNLNADVRNYVSSFPQKPYVITTNHLLSHTSGLPGNSKEKYHDFSPSFNERKYFFDGNQRRESIATNYDPLVTMQELYGNFNLSFKPGDFYQYSNWGFNLIGAIIQSASQRTYEELLEDRILCPLGISSLGVDYITECTGSCDEYLDGTCGGLTDQQVTGYYIKEDANNFLDSDGQPNCNQSWRGAGGGLASNIADLTIFVQGLINYSLLSSETTDFMAISGGEPYKLDQSKPDTDSNNLGNSIYAKGVSLYGSSNSERILGHGGALSEESSTRTQIRYSPDSKIGVVILCNTNRRGHSFGSLAATLYGIMKDGAVTTLSSPVYDNFINYQEEVLTNVLPGSYSAPKISLEGEIPENCDVTLEASIQIKLKENAKVKRGTTFKAEIVSGLDCNPQGYVQPASSRIFSDNLEQEESIGRRSEELTQSLQEGNEITLFPNPATRLFQVQFSLEKDSDVRVMITDMQGKLLESKYQSVLSLGDHSISFKSDEYSPGLYFVRVITNEFDKIKRLRVQRD
ncbi:MAG: serine hydrolase [Cyclobacteriaceae bacterium]|nr:serine hydrolase [Cyclobacteriaceae bacterium HetDA_MAG_MS6]